MCGAAGGDVLLVEATALAAHGKQGSLTLTGQLGDVLKESAHIALAWVRQNAVALHVADKVRPPVARG